jgi:hypothetical protein
VVDVFVGEHHVLGRGGPDRAEQLDHLTRMGQVGLGVDQHHVAQVDQTGVGVAHEVGLVQRRVAMVADLLHPHR